MKSARGARLASGPAKSQAFAPSQSSTPRCALDDAAIDLGVDNRKDTDQISVHQLLNCNSVSGIALPALRR